MKKWVSSVLSLWMAVCLVGCGAEKAPEPPENGFTCRTAVQYQDMTVEGTLTCTADGTMTLECTLPKSLYGVTLGYDGTGMTMGLGEMQIAVPAEKVPQSALIGCLARVLTADHTAGEMTDEGYVISGSVEEVAYTLVCDPITGLPTSLSVPAQQLTAVFTEVASL